MASSSSFKRPADGGGSGGSHSGETAKRPRAHNDDFDDMDDMMDVGTSWQNRAQGRVPNPARSHP